MRFRPSVVVIAAFAAFAVSGCSTPGSSATKPQTPESICAQYRDTAGWGPLFFVGTTITKGQDAKLNAAGYTGQCLGPNHAGLGLTAYAVLDDRDGTCLDLSKTNTIGCVGTYIEAQAAIKNEAAVAGHANPSFTIVTAIRESTKCSANECNESKF